VRAPSIYPLMITHFVQPPRNSVKPWPKCGESFPPLGLRVVLFDQREGDDGKQSNSSPLGRTHFEPEAAGLIAAAVCLSEVRRFLTI
jgi:hypothetical protein